MTPVIFHAELAGCILPADGKRSMEILAGMPGCFFRLKATIAAPHDSVGKTRTTRLLILVLFLCMSLRAEAGPVKVWQLKETAAAPVLVVGSILAVQKGERVRDGSLPRTTETRAMTADVRVLRSCTSSGKPVAVDRLRLRFLAYSPNLPPTVSFPPPLPEVEPGQVLILPLQDNKNPVSESWQLVADEGEDLTIPLRAEIAYSWPLPTTARGFIIREIANSLSRGTPREVTAVAQYLAGQREDLTPELVPLLEPAIGKDTQRWAEVATSVLATTGIPRPSIAALLSGKAKPEQWRFEPSVFIAQAALRELGPSPETDDLLIKTLIADAPIHSWGSAGILLEYADNIVTTETLRRALIEDLPGSSYIAWTLARNGHRAVLQEALARAVRVADRPNADLVDLQGAAALLRDYGNDQELQQLAGLVRKYQALDREFYDVLWQYSTEADNPREVRVLAVVLRDRHIISGQTRVCDFAVGVLEHATGQHFGAGGKTTTERDAAVSRALAWLKSQGIPE